MTSRFITITMLVFISQFSWGYGMGDYIYDSYINPYSPRAQANGFGRRGTDEVNTAPRPTVRTAAEEYTKEKCDESARSNQLNPDYSRQLNVNVRSQSGPHYIYVKYSLCRKLPEKIECAPLRYSGYVPKNFDGRVVPQAN